MITASRVGVLSRYGLWRTFDDLDVVLSWDDIDALAARFDPAGTGLIPYSTVGEEVERISGALLVPACLRVCGP
jgi:hypothetical protein